MERGKRSGRSLPFLSVVLGILLCAGVLIPSSASAAHPFLETFGATEQPSFVEAEGLAVDQSNGTLLVIDGEANTVSRWNPDGTPAEFSALGTNVIDGAGGADETPEGGLSFGAPAEVQIAVDNSGGVNNGNIYVPQAGARVVDVFGEDGTFLGQLTESSEGALVEPCGVAVDPSGNLDVGDFGGTIHKYEPAASPPVNGDNSANFPFSGNCTLAAGVGPTAGFLFAAHFLGSVAKLDATTGAEEFEIGVGPTTTLSVDPFSGNLFTAREGEVVEFDASGASGATELPPAITMEEGFAWGVAIDGSTGNVYVSRGGSANIEVFGSERPATPPTVTALDPANGPLGGGNSVTITGTDLAKVEKVEFGGTPADLSSLVEVSPTEIEIDAPAHAAGTVDVIVTTAGGASENTSADDYTYGIAPVVTGMTPGRGPSGGGNQIRITGTDLAGATRIEFGDVVVDAPFIKNTATEITLKAPRHAPGTFDVTVITSGGTSADTAADDYTFLATPGREQHK
jgi:IPT/TIG domain